MIIRANQLTKGDRFIKQGYIYIVLKITDAIYYKPGSDTGWSGRQQQGIGVRSQERVELLDKRGCPNILSLKTPG